MDQTQQTGFEEPNPTEVAGKQSKRKRSQGERMLVWGGILVMLAVVAMEWTSKEGFNTTLKSLETAIGDAKDEHGHAHGIPNADAKKLVKGLASETVTEGKPGVPRKHYYQWPSFFKLYKLVVSVDDKDRAIFVEVVIQD